MTKRTFDVYCHVAVTITVDDEETGEFGATIFDPARMDNIYPDVVGVDAVIEHLAFNALMNGFDDGTHLDKRAQSDTDFETWVEDPTSNTLNSYDIGEVRTTQLLATLPHLRVRRLTTLEAERLMGLPDNWTDIPSNTRTRRFQQIGDSVAVPMFTTIFDRIRTHIGRSEAT